MQSSPLYKSCIFSLLLNDYIVESENRDRIFSPTFVVNNFLELFLHPSIFSIKHSKSA